MKLAGILGFQPFPHNSAVSRVHVHVDQRVMNQLLREKPPDKRCLLENLNLTPERWEACRPVKEKAKTRKTKKTTRPRKHQGSRKVKRYVRRRGASLPPGAVIRSVHTDGVALSIVMKMPHTKPADKLTTEEYIAKQNDRATALFNDDDCYVVAGDPGRVNLMVAATLKARQNPVDTRPSRTRTTRTWWLKATKRIKQQEWEQKRRSRPDVAAAMNALSQSGGRRSVSVSAWSRYLDALVANKDTLHREFLENDERYVLRMERYRHRRSAISRAAQCILNEVPNSKGQPTKVVVGYGDASMKSHGRGTKDVSVPVKQLYREIIATMKRRRLDGVVIKVWEHRTTKTCYRCKEELETVYEKDEEGVDKRDAHGRRTEDRNFRRCAHCRTTEGSPKLRDRDFNASINILLALIARLKGEPRPEHLRPKKVRRKATKRRRPRK